MKNNERCGRRNKFILLAILIAVLVVGIVVNLVFVFLNGTSENKSRDVNSQVEYIDADTYFEQNAKIISKYSAKDSKNVTTESETYKILSERGFNDYPITATYNMEGEYITSEITDFESSEKHPMYSTYYATELGEIWIINVLDGSITASPVTYNQNVESTVETLIAEDDTMISYDGPLNKYYEIIPFESFAILKKVEKIDADTLESLSTEEIDKL